MARIYRLKVQEIARNTTLWMGMDVHKESWAITIVDQERIVYQGACEAKPTHLEALLQRCPGCEITAVYEAGATGYKLVKWLRALGCEAFMTAPSLVPTQSGNRVKNDRRDSVKLAELLRAGLLRSVAELSQKTYEDRELLRTREQLMDHRSDICRQIKSKLLYHSVELPDGLRPTWSKTFLHWLESAPTGSKALDACFSALVHSYRDLTVRIEALTETIEQLAESDAYSERVKLVCSIKGIGVLTAICILVELEDLNRFGSLEKLASFLGLIPGEHSTGERTRKGHITRTGNKRVRTALVEASWRVIRYDAELRRFYQRLRDVNKRGSKRAIVAVARKLSGRIRAMLRDGEHYRYPAEAQKEIA